MHSAAGFTFVRNAFLAFLLAILVNPATAWACSVCYGEPDSPATKGLTWAIVVLGAVVVCVLAGVVGFFVVASKQSGQIRPDQS